MSHANEHQYQLYPIFFQFCIRLICSSLIKKLHRKYSIEIEPTGSICTATVVTLTSFQKICQYSNFRIAFLSYTIHRRVRVLTCITNSKINFLPKGHST